MRGSPVLLLSVALLAGAALAHEGVTGPTKVRMDLMKEIGTATKALGKMAKTGAFDSNEAAALASAIADHARRIDEVFEEEHMHPKTEALPAIWQEWDRHSALGRDLVAAAHTVARAPDAERFKAAVQNLGAACKACHRDFRKD